MDKALESFVSVYDSRYGYSVVIGEHVYDMNSDAHSPNGVNMFAGNVSEYAFKETDKKIPLSELTESTKLAIADRIFGDVQFAQQE